MPTTNDGHSVPSTSTRLRDGDGFATRAIRAGQDPCAATGSTVIPIYQTATFTQDDVEVHKGYDYSRTGNPTRSALETQIAALENARWGVAFGSGMAAVAGACAVLRCGDHLLATADCYGGSYRLFVDVLPRWGIEVSFVDTTDCAAIRAALRPATKMLWVETPTNPLLRVADLRALRDAVPRNVVVAVDNTFLSPYFQRPLEHGVDLVVHSTTKYINGHSDVVGGVVVGDDAALGDAIAFHQNAVGAIPGPQDAYLTLRGAKTLAVRMRQHEAGAHAVARFLEAHDDVEAVYYPGLASHPDHDLATRQQSGFGGVVSFRVRGGAERAREVVRTTRLFNLAVSLGGVESLACIPAGMTHRSVPDQRKRELGITDDLIRLSIGLEDPDDLIADLDSALRASAPAGRSLVAAGRIAI